jgi:hypothetical protein
MSNAENSKIDYDQFLSSNYPRRIYCEPLIRHFFENNREYKQYLHIFKENFPRFLQILALSAYLNLEDTETKLFFDNFLLQGIFFVNSKTPELNDEIVSKRLSPFKGIGTAYKPKEFVLISKLSNFKYLECRMPDDQLENFLELIPIISQNDLRDNLKQVGFERQTLKEILKNCQFIENGLNFANLFKSNINLQNLSSVEMDLNKNPQSVASLYRS